MAVQMQLLPDTPVHRSSSYARNDDFELYVSVHQYVFCNMVYTNIATAWRSLFSPSYIRNDGLLSTGDLVA